VKLVPAFAAEAAYPAGGGGDREGNEQQPRRDPNRDETPLGYVMKHCAGIEIGVKTYVSEQVN